ERRARRLCVQGRALDAGSLAVERRRQGAGRTGDRRRPGHVRSDAVAAMRILAGLVILAVGAAAGAAGGLWYARLPGHAPAAISAPSDTGSTAERKILYYRDATGAPYWSAGPKKDASGRDYVPVYDDEEPTFGPGGELIKPTAQKTGPQKILY